MKPWLVYWLTRRTVNIPIGYFFSKRRGRNGRLLQDALSRTHRLRTVTALESNKAKEQVPVAHQLALRSHDGEHDPTSATFDGFDRIVARDCLCGWGRRRRQDRSMKRGQNVARNGRVLSLDCFPIGFVFCLLVLLLILLLVLLIGQGLPFGPSHFMGDLLGLAVINGQRRFLAGLTRHVFVTDGAKENTVFLNRHGGATFGLGRARFDDQVATAAGGGGADVRGLFLGALEPLFGRGGVVNMAVGIGNMNGVPHVQATDNFGVLHHLLCNGIRGFAAARAGHRGRRRSTEQEQQRGGS
jgi:hypothetical protein